jgi:TonB family protein
MESQTTSDAPAESQSGPPPARRLVIRVKIPKGMPPAPVQRRLSRGALLSILGAVAVVAVLSWVGIGMRAKEPTSAPVVTAPVVSDKPPPTVEPTTEATPAQPEVRQQPNAPPSAINEVIPNVPRSARDTIRGTIRVTIRVIVDRGGTVLATTTDEPGPSRYFERLATEAAKQWTFAPVDSAEQRTLLVRFYFKRAGTTGRAIPLEKQ